MSFKSVSVCHRGVSFWGVRIVNMSSGTYNCGLLLSHYDCHPANNIWVLFLSALFCIWRVGTVDAHFMSHFEITKILQRWPNKLTIRSPQFQTTPNKNKEQKKNRQFWRLSPFLGRSKNNSWVRPDSARDSQVPRRSSQPQEAVMWKGWNAGSPLKMALRVAHNSREKDEKALIQVKDLW